MTDRHGIGGNAPPPEETFSLHVDELFSLLSDSLAGGAVASDEAEAAIDALLDDFRKAGKDAEKARKDEKQPHLDAGKAVDAKWKPITDKADKGAEACKQALTPYRREKQRLADEAARKAREEAEQKAKAAQEALRAADDLEVAYQAEQALKEAGKLQAQANKIERAPTGLRTIWRAEVTDLRAALICLYGRDKQPFADLIQSLADREARGARGAIEGVTYHREEKAN